MRPLDKINFDLSPYTIPPLNSINFDISVVMGLFTGYLIQRRYNGGAWAELIRVPAIVNTLEALTLTGTLVGNAIELRVPPHI